MDLPEQLTYPQMVKKFPSFYGTRRFITVLTKARLLFLFRASKDQSKSEARWHVSNFVRFHGEELLVRRPTPKLEEHHLSAVRYCLFNQLPSISGGRSTIGTLGMRQTVVAEIQLPWRRVMVGGIIQFSAPCIVLGHVILLPCRWDKRGMAAEQIARINKKDNAV